MNGNNKTFTRHPIFWLPDGSVTLCKNETLFKVHRSLIDPLSKTFFEPGKILESYPDAVEKNDIIYRIISPSLDYEDVETIFRHLYNQTDLDANAPFDYVLRLYVSTSPERADMPSVHQLAAEHLKNILEAGPLKIDFTNTKSIQAALQCATSSKKLEESLEKALYYSFMISDTVIYPDEQTSNAEHDHDIPGDALARESSPAANSYHLTQTEAHITTHLMTSITTLFSPIIFQPVNGSHMACTDIFAKYWVTLAVEPAFEFGGLCDTFRTLNRLSNIQWAGTLADGDGGDDSDEETYVGVCEECLKRVREEWEEEANNIWAKIGEWIKEAKKSSEGKNSTS